MNDLLSVLKALSDETRLNIVRLLLEHDFCVGALAKHTSVSKAAVSQHLQVLRKVGLVKGEKRGYYTHYSVNRALLSEAGDKLIKLARERNKAEEGCRRSAGSTQACCGGEGNGDV